MIFDVGFALCSGVDGESVGWGTLVSTETAAAFVLEGVGEGMADYGGIGEECEVEEGDCGPDRNVLLGEVDQS